MRPSVALFLADGERGLPPDWFDRLHRDEGEPFNVERHRFTLTSHHQALEFFDAAATTHALVGSAEAARERTTGAVLAYWAQGAGFVGMGDAMEVFNFQGQLSPEDIEKAHEKWWEYWKEYWRRIDGPDPLPEDYACEVTIPAGEDDEE